MRRSDGGSVAKIEVSVEPVAAENAEKTWSQSTFTNRRGEAKFDSLPPGRYRFRGGKETLRRVDGGALEAEIQDRPVFVDVEISAMAVAPPVGTGR